MSNHLLISCDYAQAELCSLAQVCIDKFGYSEMGRLINEDIDLHLHFVARMYDQSYEDLLKRKKEPQVKEWRQAAKCFHPDTEVLTKTGWVRLSDLTEGTEIAAAHMGDNFKCEILWQAPTRLTTRQAETLIHLKNEGIDLLVTPDHRMAAWRANGNAYQPAPIEMNKARYWPNAGVEEKGQEQEEEGLLRLAVATQADGSYTSSGIRFGFTKPRKIERLKTLLSPYVGWEIRKQKNATTFYIKGVLANAIKRLLDADKTLPWRWLTLSLRCRAIVLEEARFWDSHSFTNGVSYGYCSYETKNLEVLQALASISGKKSRKSLDEKKLTIRTNRMSRGENITITSIPYNSTVYCVTVPSDAILVRYKGVTVITHQCANFGFPGGLGVSKFVAYARDSYGVELEEHEAKRMKDAWLETYPEMRAYFNWISQRLSVAEYISIVQHRSGRTRGRVGYTDGCNTFFQGLTADGASMAVNLLNREAWLDESSPIYGARMIGFFYDEFFGSIPDKGAAANTAAAMRICDVMKEAMAMFTPDVKAKVEPALMRNWSKAAEPVFDSNGYLIPWEDAAS